MVDYNLIKKLIEIVKNEGISGISVEENGVKYEIKREHGGVIPEPTPEFTPSDLSRALSREAEGPVPSHAKEEDNLVAITSPMVGTYYAATSPDSPPLAKIGDHVSTGKVVCIIEAMKLFNEIESEVSGTIVKILAENGKPVEYGQKLMLIKKE